MTNDSVPENRRGISHSTRKERGFFVNRARLGCLFLRTTLAVGGAFWIGCTSSRESGDAEQRFWEERFRRDEAWEEKLGKQIDVEGIAENVKVGPMVGGLGIDGLREWPGEVLGKRLRATGILIRRDDLPVFHRDPKDPPPAGIPVPRSVDLERARRWYLLAQAHWEVIGH
jgi:hypothetical protein